MSSSSNFPSYHGLNLDGCHSIWGSNLSSVDNFLVSGDALDVSLANAFVSLFCSTSVLVVEDPAGAGATVVLETSTVVVSVKDFSVAEVVLFEELVADGVDSDWVEAGVVELAITSIGAVFVVSAEVVVEGWFIGVTFSALLATGTTAAYETVTTSRQII